MLLADVRHALDLSPGPLGVAIFVGAAASILAMAGLGWTADRLGRRVFLVGLALSGVAPIAFSSAGDLAPERAGSAISVVTTLGYGGFLLWP